MVEERGLPPAISRLRRASMCRSIFWFGRETVARAHPRAPQCLGDVLDSPHAHSSKTHLDQRFLHRLFPPLVALDNRRLKGQRPQLRHLQPCHQWLAASVLSKEDRSQSIFESKRN